MAFKTYATKIECYDDESEKLAFTLETNDKSIAELTINKLLVGNGCIDLLHIELKKAIALLELE